MSSGASSAPSLRIAFIHRGPADHGVARHGRLIAEQVRRLEHVSVVERECAAMGSVRNVVELWRALIEVRTADVLHLQYSPYGRHLWGSGWRQLLAWLTIAMAPKPPLVVSYHDAYTAEDAPPRARATRRWIAVFERWLVLRLPTLLIVGSRNEARALARRIADVNVVPLQAEPRRAAGHLEEARQRWSVQGATVVTLLGHILSEDMKGHGIAVEVLAMLPAHFTLVFAGADATKKESHTAALLARAKALGVADRLRLTGRLTEEELDAVIALTDVAFCPFRFAASSASLSTWIGALRPIVGSDIPLLREYEALSDGTLRTAPRDDVAALAEAVRSVAQNPPPLVQREAFAALLSPNRIAAQHVEHYRMAASPNARGRTS